MGAVLGVWILAMIIGTAIGMSKGRGALGFLLSALLGIVGVIVIAVLPSGHRCPICMGSINSGAMVCQHCGENLAASRS